MEFTKMQGAANDFVMVDGRNLERDWPKLAVAVCDRHLGVGADSLILVLDSDKADYRMRIFDADGSEAETCGNGIRCVARYLLEKRLVGSEASDITIETVTTINRVEFVRVGETITGFRVNMGKPRFNAEEIPFKPTDKAAVETTNGMLIYRVTVNGWELRLNLISMGNPHAVYFIDEPVGDFPLSVIGPLVEHLPVFPNRTNFMVARILDTGHIEARSWERGVGETMACGSGACAIAVASYKLGNTGSTVAIKLPGGVLNADWNGEGEIVLGGPAEVVFEGIWPD